MTVTNFTPLSGGLGTYVENLARQLALLDQEVTVLTLLGAETTSEELDGVRVLRLPRQASYRDVFAAPVKRASRQKLAEAIKGADIVNAHTRYFPMTYLSVKYAKELKVPVVVTEHGGGFVTSPSPVTSLVAKAVDATTGRWALRNADNVFCVSDTSRAFIKGLSGVEASVVGNGVDLTFWNRQKAVGNRASALPTDSIKNVVFVGRLVAEKGWKLLLETWQALSPERRKGSRLVFVGDGPDMPELRRMIGVAQLDDVVALGEQPATLIRDLLCTGILVNPSFAAEGFQTTLLEARALGTFVVTTPVGGASETVTDAEHGVIVDTTDKGDWAAAIARAITRAGEAVGRGSIDEFSWERVGHNYLKALETSYRRSDSVAETSR